MHSRLPHTGSTVPSRCLRLTPNDALNLLPHSLLIAYHLMLRMGEEDHLLAVFLNEVTQALVLERGIHATVFGSSLAEAGAAHAILTAKLWSRYSVLGLLRIARAWLSV